MVGPALRRVLNAAPAIHVVGAGLAGLAAAVSLARDGWSVTLHEAAGSAGGRCRSFTDPVLDRVIDNGNHLLLSGNRNLMRYLRTIGTSEELDGPETACFPFLDLRTRTRWQLRPNSGWLPWWPLDPRRRVPDTAPADYLRGLRFATAGSGATVTDCVGEGGRLFESMWEPLATAVLNTPPRRGAAVLLRRVLREAFAPGEGACRPRIARATLSEVFVDPALDLLARGGADVRFGHRLQRIGSAGGRAHTLDFGTDGITLREHDGVVLAVPPPAAADVIPGIRAPRGSRPIVNVHFVPSEPATLPWGLPFLGLVGGVAQWLFVRGEVASVTISAADGIVDLPSGTIAQKTWADAARALGHDVRRLPPYRVVKERRATFDQTPENLGRRPGTRSALANVWLAGDWIDTGLPATMESAARSGYLAAQAAARWAARHR